MPDWRQYVKERLGSADEKVVQELAEHLEDVYSELRTSGVTQEEAIARVERQVDSWPELRREIRAAREGEMHERVKQFWLPSLVTLLAGWGILAILLWAGVQPFMTRPGQPDGLFVYWPWLAALPFVGAWGAYMARRAKSQSWMAHVAGAFPAVAMALVFVSILPWVFAVNPQVVPGVKAISIAANFVSWVVLPGAALYLGIAVQGMWRTPSTNA